MSFAFWLQFIAILGSCSVSVYLSYAAWLVYRQSASVGVSPPSSTFYLFLAGVSLFMFSAGDFTVRFCTSGDSGQNTERTLEPHERPNQALQPTPLPVALLFFMSYRRVMKPRPQRRG